MQGSHRRASPDQAHSVTRRCRHGRFTFRTRMTAKTTSSRWRRLRGAIALCGFTDIVFEYEPVAAAYSYEQTLDRDELILIGDFGGGTSDFSILRVGPDRAAARARARRHHRHRWRRGRRRRVRPADHPKARRTAIGHRIGVFLAARQVPADSKLAVRTARALASSVVPEYRQEPRDAGAPAAQRRSFPNGSRRSCTLSRTKWDFGCTRPCGASSSSCR